MQGRGGATKQARRAGHSWEDAYRGLPHGENVAIQIPAGHTSQGFGGLTCSVGLNDAAGKFVQFGRGAGCASVDATEAAVTLQSLRTRGQRQVAVLLDPLVIQPHQSTSSEFFAQNSFQASQQEGYQGPHPSCPTVAYRTKHQTEYGSAADGCSTPSDGSPISHVLFTSGDQQEYLINHSHDTQRAAMVRKQLVFCGWDGARVGGVRSSITSFRDHVNKVRKCAKQLVDGFVSCLDIGETLYVENCLARSWQLKPSQAHPQVELKVASTGLFVLAEGWNGDWDRITQGHVVTAQDANGDNILSEVRLEGCRSEVIYVLTADQTTQTVSERSFDLDTREADLHHVLSQISKVLACIGDAFDAEIKPAGGHNFPSLYQSVTPQLTKTLCQSNVNQGEVINPVSTQKPGCFYHTHFTKAYDREKLIQYLKNFDEKNALDAYPRTMPMFTVPNAGNLRIPGHVVLRGKPEGVRGPKTGTARWGADGKYGFLIVGAEANAKQNKELEERYEKGIYPVAIFLITNPASFEHDDRFRDLPQEVWTDGEWEIHEQPLHSNSTELVGPNGYSYQPPPGWRWIEIRQKKEERKRYRQQSRNSKRARGIPSRIVLMNMKNVIIDFKQEVRNGVLDLGTKRCSVNAAEDV